MGDELWTHKGNKFVIGTLHGELIEISAQYNPKELARHAAASWTPHPNTSARQSKTGENAMWQEYGTTEPRTLTLDLMFDGYEERVSITPLVEKLENLTSPVDMRSKKPSERRPQLCVAVWGNQKFCCVVTSVATKLTVFDTDGTPLRAVCTVALSEIDAIAVLDGEKESSNLAGRDARVSRSSKGAR